MIISQTTYRLFAVSLIACSQLFSAMTAAAPIPADNSDSGNATSSDGTVLAVGSETVSQFELWVKYASAAYCDVTGWDCGLACQGQTTGTNLIKWFNETDNKAYVAVNHAQKSIIMAFRGTADVQSFMADSQFELSDYPGVPGAQVHTGFLDTFNATKDEISSTVKDTIQQNPDYQVISVGHSMGGAMAVLQTLDLMGTNGLSPQNLITYTYGEPRIGNLDFANYVNSQGYPIYRVVNHHDLIPHLPPTPAFSYIHHSAEYWLPPNNTMIECTHAEDPSCSNSLGLDVTLLDHINYFDTAFLLTCLVKA